MTTQESDPSSLNNRKSWWQQCSNSLSMALGKKSFLIRDILESHSQNGSMITQPPNSGLIEWIQNRVEHASQPSVDPQAPDNAESDRLLVSSHEGSSFETTEQESTSNMAINPFIQNWLSMNLSPRQEILAFPVASIPNGKSPLPVSSSFYQNLYYYALHQQINASLIGRLSATNEGVPLPTSPTGEPEVLRQANKSKNWSLKFKRSQCVPSVNVRNSQNVKPKKVPNKTGKKPKITKKLQLKMPTDELTSPPENGLDLTKANNSQIDAIECNCEVNEDSDEAIDLISCGAKSKCKKLRRNRTVFTELQLMGLERRFDSQKYLSTPDRADLARALGLTQLQVKTWYQNRRMKWKKQVMQNGCPYPPTKPKGRPKKDSIPTYGLEFTNSILCPIFASHSIACSPSPAIVPFSPKISPMNNSS